MSDNLQKLGALAFALVAISVSGTAIHNAFSSEGRMVIPSLGDERLLSGQVAMGGIPINEFTAEQTAQGVTLPADAHNFFTCNTGGAVSVETFNLESVRAWVYEFTGNEPPFTGKFWISPGELDKNPQYASVNTLKQYTEGKRYYSMGDTDLSFQCGEGVSLDFVCGDGILQSAEECDDGNAANKDGCDDGCQIEPFYQCSGTPSSCSPIVPMLPGVTETHTECVDDQCTEVDGVGDNECSTDFDCEYPNPKITELEVDASTIYIQFSLDDREFTDALIWIDQWNPNVPHTTGQKTLFYKKWTGSSDSVFYLEDLPPGDYQISVRLLLPDGSKTGLSSPHDFSIKQPTAGRAGNLYVIEDSTPTQSHQLLGGVLGEPVLRLEFHAEDEDIDVTNIRLINKANIESLDSLDLFIAGSSTPFAKATAGECVGNGSENVFCAYMQSRQLVIPEGQEIDVLVRPRIKTDEQGGKSKETVEISLIDPSYNLIAIEARGDASANILAQNDSDTKATGEIFIGTNTPGPNGTYPTGLGNHTVHAKITSIVNANPDANGSAVPTGVSPIGQFTFTAAEHSNSKDGNNDAVLSGLIFNMNATNVAINATTFKLYNKADQTQTLDCQAHYLGGQVFTAASISGAFYVKCDGIDASIVDNEIDNGANATFVLQADIVNPNIAAASGGSSSLQVSLTEFNNPGPNLDIGFGFDDSHIRWFDKDGSTNALFHWIEYPETTVKSTAYNS